MNSTLLPRLGLMLVLPLTAQDAPNGNRMGLALYGLQAAGGWAGDFQNPGGMLALHIHFNREGSNLGRLYIGHGKIKGSRDVRYGDLYSFPNPWPAPPVVTPDMRRVESSLWTVGYEVMPHFKGHSREGAFAILGIGGALWRHDYSSSHPNELYGGSYFWNSTDDDLAFQATVGGGYRFNLHWTVEARFTVTELTTRQSNRVNGDYRNFFSLGAGYRF